MKKRLVDVDTIIKNILKEKASQCTVSVCAFEANRNIFLYNEKYIHDAACTLKVFIMLEYYKQLFNKVITGNELLEVSSENFATGAGSVKFLSCGVKVRASDLVELMVAISDHMAANMLIDFLGMDNINSTIKEYGFNNTRLLKKYLVPKSIHVAETTAEEYSRFFYLLDNNKFFSTEICENMRSILKSQKYKDFLAEPLLGYYKKGYINMMSKSGKVDGTINKNAKYSCFNDGGICLTEKGNYYISFLSEIPVNSGIEISEVKYIMNRISKAVFEEYMGI